MLKISANQALIAANILAQGFVDDPIWKFILPKPQNRLQILTAMFKVFVDDGIKRGEVLIVPNQREVLIVPNQQGAIIWYPSQVNVFDDTFANVEAKIKAIACDFQEFDAIQRFEILIVRAIACSRVTRLKLWVSVFSGFPRIDERPCGFSRA